MDLDKRDIKVLGIVVFVILLFAALFYYDLNKRIDIGDREVIGNIYFKNNIVQRKLDDQVIWERMENGSPLTNKDTIRSEAFSDALIKLKDGTEINIDENSMFNLDLTGEKPSLEFSVGSLQVKKGTSKDGGILIKAQGNEIDVQDGNLKLERGSKKDINVFVEKGATKIKKDGKEIEVEGGKKAEIGESGSVNVKKIPAKLKGPDSQALFLIESGTGQTNVIFTYDLESGFSEPVLEISRSPVFKSILFEKKGSGESITASLGEGTYFWRIKAKSQSDGSIDSSDVGKFFIQKEEPFRADSPANGSKYSFVNEPPLVGFVWTKLGTARGYKYELADNPSLTKPLRSIDTEANTISFNDLKEGIYYWRVTAFSAFPGTPDKPSNVMSFTVKQEQNYPAPNLIRPSNGAEISLDEIEKGQASVIWEANSELTKYKIEISRDSKFASVIQSRETNANFVNPAWKELGTGAFFLRLRGTAKDGRDGDYSAPSKFTIVEQKTPDEEPPPPKKEEPPKEKPKAPPPVELVSPVNSIVEMKGKKSLDFQWTAEPGVDRFEFTLYEVSGNKRNSVYRQTTKSMNLLITDLSILDEGNFSWELLEVRTGFPLVSRKANFIITLDQLKTLKASDIEFISPKKLYKGDKK